MIRLVVLLSVVTNISCVTSSQPKFKNRWVALNDSKEVKCDVWPMSEKDLEVVNLIPTSGEFKEAGVVGAVRQRNSSIQNVYMPYDSSYQFDTDNAIIVPVSQSSNILGAWSTEAGPVVLVANKLGARSTFELRNVKENKIISKSQFVIDDEISSADYVAIDKTAWVALRSGDYSTSVIKLTFAGKNSLIEKLPVTSSVRGAHVVLDETSRIPYLVEPQLEGSKFNLKVKKIGIKADQVKSIGEISIPSKSVAESWAFSSAPGGFYFAAVFGDSMVGQGVLSKGLIAINDGGMSIKWSSDEVMLDLHLSEPIFVAEKGISFLIILKWLDADATIGVIEMNAGKVVPRGNHGVLAKGSAVINAVVSKESKIAAIVRQKIKESWKFSMCRLAVK